MALTGEDLQAIARLISQTISPINSRLDKMDSRLDKMDSRLDEVDKRLDKLESQVSALRAGQIDIQKEIKQVDKKVSDTYGLALEAWATTTENRKWLEASNR